MTSQHTPAPRASHAIVPAGPPDTGILAQLIAAAFHPLDVCRWLVPDETDRRAMFPGYFRLWAEPAIASGLVHTTPGRDAAALWLPGTGPAAPPDRYGQRLATITGRYLDRFLAFDEELEARHPTGTQHHYLAILAVRPGRQGQGLGTALLQAHHVTLDAGGTSAYLAASDLRTRRLYLRHGYTDHGSPIQLPGGPQMYPLLRQPQPHQPAG
jgi:GNAT superfamily N-acetyltransferase